VQIFGLVVILNCSRFWAFGFKKLTKCVNTVFYTAKTSAYV